jgi:hypothetical protein
MPSPPVHARDVPVFVRGALITTAILIGIGYTFGPASFSSSPSFDVLKSFSWFPIQAWGLCFMLAGVLMGTTRLVGYAFAVMLWGTWGMGLVLAAFEGKLSGWGGAVYPFFYVAIAGYEVYRWGQKHLMQVRTRQQTGFR